MAMDPWGADPASPARPDTALPEGILRLPRSGKQHSARRKGSRRVSILVLVAERLDADGISPAGPASMPGSPARRFACRAAWCINALMQSRLPRAALALLLALGSAAVHAGALDQGFVNFDDGHFVQGNPFVREGFSARSVRWAFTAHLTFDAGRT